MSAARAHHLSCGTMCPFGRSLLEGRGSVFEPATLVAHCLLVELSDRLILVDTGFGTADVEAPMKRLGAGFMMAARPQTSFADTAFSQIKTRGFSVEDVTDIVVTHLDLDHAGGLSDFPNARIHVNGAELLALRARKTQNEKMRYRTVQFAHDPKWVPHDISGDLWFGFDAVRAVPESEGDVLIVPLEGHTRGHSGVAVRTEGGWLLHAGDAYFNHAELEEPPSCPTGLSIYQRFLAIDDDKRVKNQERLRELVRDHRADVTVFSAHCNVEWDRLKST